MARASILPIADDEGSAQSRRSPSGSIWTSPAAGELRNHAPAREGTFRRSSIQQPTKPSKGTLGRQRDRHQLEMNLCSYIDPEKRESSAANSLPAPETNGG
jgi:hypothetical protein